MKLRLLIILIFLLPSSVIAGETDSAHVYRFYDFNAYTIGAGNFQYSIFGFSTYGISNTFEVSAHPLMLFVSPSVDFQYALSHSGNFSFAGISSFNYPTMLMRMVAKKGTGGFISPEFNIPQMISIRNGIVGTLKLGEQQFINGRFLFEFALKSGALDPGSSIDLPVIAPHSAVYYHDAGFALALAAEGRAYSWISYHCKSEIFLFPFISEEYKEEYPLGQEHFFVDISGTLVWHLSRSAILATGCKLTYGDYPFGGQWHLLPTIDFKKWIE
jgi:hypothetical protein